LQVGGLPLLRLGLKLLRRRWHRPIRPALSQAVGL
jgi:hypothetical protein